MRERTPSADDTPKRAPPAPPRDAASTDVAGSKTSNGTVESYRTARYPTTTSTASSCATTTTTTTSTGNRMVASTHNLEDLGVSHPASGNNERQQQQQLQEKHGHTYRSAQTAQDKRSRLSNVINNLRKKVPDTRNVDSPRKEEDGRNSVERNLETLEKYVMTVLNGVIKDEEEEEEDRDIERKKETTEHVEKAKDGRNDEDERREGYSKDKTVRPIEASQPNKSRTEVTVSIAEADKIVEKIQERKDEHLERDTSPIGNFVESKAKEEKIIGNLGKNTENLNEERERIVEEEKVESKSLREDALVVEKLEEKIEKIEENFREAMSEDAETISKENESSSKEIVSETLSNLEEIRSKSPELHDDKKEVRSLGTIIMERLSEHQTIDERIDEETNENEAEALPDNSELRTICRDLLNDLLSGINRLIGEDKAENEDCRSSEAILDESRDSSASHEVSTTSLHCSLPLDKVASVLQNCQASEMASPRPPSSPSSPSTPSSPSSPTQIVSKSPSKPPSPIVRHLCLYCDRKFLSISLRQRHTERVHQLGGGRRSERNSRKPSQNCQYCSDKCAESLEGLFQHMVGSHADKYHACVQCSTRYLTREALVGHMSETHGSAQERTQQSQDKIKDSPFCKDLNGQSLREKSEMLGSSSKERRSEEKELEPRPDFTLLKHAGTRSAKDAFSSPGSPEFDSSFYSSVSCNIRENLLHHLDGKLQSCSTSSSTPTTTSISESKQQQQLSPQQQTPQQQQQQQQQSQQSQQSFYEHNQIQLPIDISLTAATPVYNKDYSSEEYENSSEYAQKPGKTGRSHPRRVSFEKYNFPRKYDGKEQWSCSIKDLSKFDISTQLSLRKKQQSLKERISLNRPNQSSFLTNRDGNTDLMQTSLECDATNAETNECVSTESTMDPSGLSKESIDDNRSIDRQQNTNESIANDQAKYLIAATEFSIEFSNFLKLRKWDETSNEAAKKQEVVYAELTGEWSRPRVYICGACAARHVTLKEMEDHKASMHPNVWCSHFEFSGDQRELYKHLFLPGRSVPTAKAKNAVLTEKVCTKCSKNCTTLPELHRHMLECGGDQAWLLGHFGNGKKKCKWRPFGSRSRRRRQRGMKRNIQNSQTPRVNVQKDNTPKQPPGPRVRPSDRESIQKMLANLPPKRTTRKVLQDSTLRVQGRLRNVQTRSRPRIVGESSTVSRISRNKAALRNKLLKNAKSIQRNRCRSDNISAVIESVVKNCSYAKKLEDGTLEVPRNPEGQDSTKETPRTLGKNSTNSETDERRIKRGPKVLGKKRNIKTKDGAIRSFDYTKSRDKKGPPKPKGRPPTRNILENNEIAPNDPSKTTPKNKTTKSEKETENNKSNPSSTDSKSSSSLKNKIPTVTTPKRKRPVDPVASLNASIKAKSQLRTQDGKFARNPNKSTQLEQKSPISGRQIAKLSQSNESNVDSFITRSKARTVNKTISNKNVDVQIPRRTTRLSSDSDKMPTLEPVHQLSSNDEYVEKAPNDLPILSPVTMTNVSNNSDQKTTNRVISKNSSTCKLSNDEKNPVNREGNDNSVEKISTNSSQTKTSVQVEEEKQKSTRGRKPKADKNIEQRNRGTSLETNEASQRSIKSDGLNVPTKNENERTRSRKSIPTKNLSVNKLSKSLDDVTKKDPKTKSEEAGKSFETRSNVKARQERWSDSIEDKIKSQGIPFEVKKLLGSGSKEDLLTKLGLTSREISSKRTLRQSIPRSKITTQIKSKFPKELESENIVELNSETNPEPSSSKLLTKKTQLLRKSPRHANSDKQINLEREKNPLESKTEEIDRNNLDLNSGKSTIKNKQNCPEDLNKSTVSQDENNLEENKIENSSQFKTESTCSGSNDSIETSNTENITTKRQTRSSLMIMNVDEVESKTEITDETGDASLKRTSIIGKRRGRIKSTIDTTDKKIQMANDVDEESKKSPNKTTVDQSEKDEKSKGDKARKITKSTEADDIVDAEIVNASLTNLQMETSNSIDSGKENSLETPLVSQRKVGRPRKSWGTRRDKNTSKRSLSNVIGILTEGMNIPVQQSVVLTVQTSVENVNSDVAHRNNAQQPADGNTTLVESNVPPVGTSVSILNGEKSNDKSEEINENGTAISNVQSDNLADGSIGESGLELSGTDSDKIPEPEMKNITNEKDTNEKSTSSKNSNNNCLLGTNSDVDKSSNLSNSDKSSSVSNAPKSQSPTNDIILDLSRRKTKGKGSFLEKIVSKIAKQKDALLEGEVGTLLDSAADELTSILDEVTPASENGENTNGTKKGGTSKTRNENKNTSNNNSEKNPDKSSVSNNKKEPTNKNPITVNKSSENITDVRKSSDNISIAISEISDHEISGKIVEVPADKVRGQIENKSESKPDVKIDVPVENIKGQSDAIKSLNEREENQTKNQLHSETSVESVENGNEKKVSDSILSKLEEQSTFVPNGAQLSVTETCTTVMQSSSPIRDALDLSINDKDKTSESARNDTEIVGERSRRKSVKRSLEVGSPKKNKRKSIQVEEIPEENIQEEIQLADIMKLIHNPQDPILSTYQSINSLKDDKTGVNSNGQCDSGKIQVGKRKSIEEDSSTKMAVNQFSKIDEIVKEGNILCLSTNEMSNAKKLKTDVESNVECKRKLEEEKAIEKEQLLQSKSEENTKAISEEQEKGKSSIGEVQTAGSTLKRKGKRKSLPESTSDTTELSNRRISKQNLLPEDKRLSSPVVSESLLFKNDPKAEESKRSLESNTSEVVLDKIPPETDSSFTISKLENEAQQEKDNDESTPDSDLASASKETISTEAQITETLSNSSSNLDNHENKTIDNSQKFTAIEINKSTTEKLEKIPMTLDINIPEVKVPKKRGRKKKNPVDPNLNLSANDTNKQSISADNFEDTKTAESTIKSTEVNLLQESKESEKVDITSNKNENATIKSNEMFEEPSSTNLEPFKIPEVSEVLQHTKKRASKRKSLMDEHLDLDNLTTVQETNANVNSTEYSVAQNIVPLQTESEKVGSNEIQKPRGRGRPPKKLNKESEKMERSSSSDSINLASSGRTRWSKRKQRSTDDIMSTTSQENTGENTDNLSEASCASESSYFRKKRFSKKKKDVDEHLEDVQTDTSITDSESMDTEKSSNSIPRRQVPKRKAKKNISLIDEHLDLVAVVDSSSNDAFFQYDLENAIITSSISQEQSISRDESTIPESEKKPENIITSNVSNSNIEMSNVSTSNIEISNIATPNVSISNDTTHEMEQEKEKDDIKETERIQERQEIETNENGTSVEKLSSTEEQQDLDNRQVTEDFQTPKKRAAGNFVVVHTKTGEILIVEKRKKLTKEAARFFCDVCSTSFTRKSSLKKHNSSQSHLLQISKYNKEREKGMIEPHENISMENLDEIRDSSTERNETSSRNELSIDQRENLTEQTINSSMESSKNPPQSTTENISLARSETQFLEMNGVYPRFSVPVESTVPAMSSHSTRQEALEDELLDQEICKITENMSQDEYVLVDEVSDTAPEASSTPVAKISEDARDGKKKKKKNEKKREKQKKKSLAEEHLDLNISDTKQVDTSIEFVKNTSNLNISSDTSSKFLDSSVGMSDQVEEENLSDPRNCPTENNSFIDEMVHLPLDSASSIKTATTVSNVTSKSVKSDYPKCEEHENLEIDINMPQRATRSKGKQSEKIDSTSRKQDLETSGISEKKSSKCKKVEAKKETSENLENNSESQSLLNSRPKRKRQVVGYAEDMDSDIDDVLLNDSMMSFEKKQIEEILPTIKTSKENTEFSDKTITNIGIEMLNSSDDTKAETKLGNKIDTSTSKTNKKRSKRNNFKGNENENENIQITPDSDIGLENFKSTESNVIVKENEIKENQLQMSTDEFEKVAFESVEDIEESKYFDNTRSPSKSRKNKTKKQSSEKLEEAQSYFQVDNRKSRKAGKHKRDHNKQVLEEIDYTKLSDSNEIIKSSENAEQEYLRKEINQINQQSVPPIVAMSLHESHSEYDSLINNINLRIPHNVSQEEIIQDKLADVENIEKSLILSTDTDILISKSNILENEESTMINSLKTSFGSLEECNKKSKKLEQVTEQQEIQIASSTNFINEPVINYSSNTNNQEQMINLLPIEDDIDKSNCQEIPILEDTNSKTNDFDSDEDSVNTDISADIQKLLDDSEIPEKIEEKSHVSMEEEEASLKILQTEDQNQNLELPNLDTNVSSESELLDDDDDDVTENFYASTFDEDVTKVPADNIYQESTELEIEKSKSRTEALNINLEAELSSPTKKSTKVHKTANKEVHRKRKAPAMKKKATKSKIDLGSDSDVSDNEDRMESENKNKIVKSVFGRVFGGEKTDKVKEVLNDWVSKSEDDSDASRTKHDSSSSTGKSNTKNKKKRSPTSSNKRPRNNRKNTKSFDRTKERSTASDDQEDSQFVREHEKSKNNSKAHKKHENKTSNDTNITNPDYNELVLPTSRCRQSKKRAEERISRAFDDSPIPREDINVSTIENLSRTKDVSYVLRNQSKSDHHSKENDYRSFSNESINEIDTANVSPTENYEESVTGPKIKLSESRKGKKRTNDDIWKDDEVESKEIKSQDRKVDLESPLIRRSMPEKEEDPVGLISNVDRTESALSRPCSSLAPSSIRNRTPSLDRSSQSTGDSEEENEDEDRDAFDEDRRRLSPLYARGSLESSMDSDSSSEEEEEEEEGEGEEEGNIANEEENVATRKRSSSEFSGEKIVIRSPTSSHRDSRAEVVTIAPTDAIEDNALDVPQEIEATKPPRQGKVLNFDEELFVECCSRLKATTENELRGAKKIKLDHSEPQGFRNARDRWRDVESQNSLGSLLESVNQLLGEEMYSTRERDYTKRSTRNLHSEHSSRSVSPDVSRADNIGYEDSLDVAFEHNNKLRDKIQQRMRESENLIASTFGQKNRNNETNHYEDHQNRKHDEDHEIGNPYGHRHDHLSNLSNGEYNDSAVRQDESKAHLDSTGFKTKMNSALGGLLDKALSNLLHSNGKHDHNGSTPMKVLAELACARAPTSTSDSYHLGKTQHLKITSTVKESVHEINPSVLSKDSQIKKTRNPIKELFERKKEMNERKQQERSKAEAALRELNVQKQRKTKKTKKCQDFPLIRRNEYGGMPEKKKRRDGFERKEELPSERIKDVYDFDEEESQIEPSLGTGLSYRNRSERNYEVSCLKAKELDMAGLVSKAIGDTLENGKGDALGARLESMIDRKFKEIEKFAPKTKGALKSFQSEVQQPRIGPMDEFVERKQRSKKVNERTNSKQLKLRKRNKNFKKKARNAWYENDSSDEFRTAAKTEDVGVGISKSQRTCSKGKQNLFAELSTSSESEFEQNEVDYEQEKHRRSKKTAKKTVDISEIDLATTIVDKYHLENGEEDAEVNTDEWQHQVKENSVKNDCDNKKSESEMSDHPLVIDERKDTDEQRQSDDDVDNRSAGFELDDLYREDSSVAESDLDENTLVENGNIEANQIETPRETFDKEETFVSLENPVETKTNYLQEEELIPLEEALDLLDQPDALQPITEEGHKTLEDIGRINESMTIEERTMETIDRSEESKEDKYVGIEEQDEESNDNIPELPEKLSTNEKPQKESENLPLHVFLSRKVQESKKRKQLQLKKLQEEQERILMDFQPTRRQRKCAIGKQGLLAEISSSDEELYVKDTSKKISEKSDHEKQRKQKRESKEKRKERYLEKKHEQIIAKEQKAIEEEILRELGKKKESLAQNTTDVSVEMTSNDTSERENTKFEDTGLTPSHVVQKKKHQQKEKQRKNGKTCETIGIENEHLPLSDSENNLDNPITDSIGNLPIDQTITSETQKNSEQSAKQKKNPKSPTKPRKPKSDPKVTNSNKKGKNCNDRSKNRSATANGKDCKERKTSSSKRDSDDEELKTTKSWNKVEEGVGVAIGRRKRAAANQLYYWSSSSDEEETIEPTPVVEEEEDDRQEQHGWIVGDSHKRMITMLAMEKQLKEKRRRSEDEFEPGKTKNKKHRNSTS